MARQATPDLLGDPVPADDPSIGAMFGPQVIDLDIAAIRLDGGTQPRAGIDQAVVADYAADMANGAEFPPVQVVYDGEAYWLWDGFHRLHARQQAGQYTVPAIVRSGTRRDAVLLSVGANATHGFRRSSEDKRRSVETLLRDPEWTQWADREIARRCAVDHKTVSVRRAALSGEIPQIETRRVERNGTEYTMAPAQRSPTPYQASQEANYVTVWQLEQGIRKWLVAFEDAIGVMESLKEHKGGSAYFDDLIAAGDLPKPHHKRDIFQACNNVLEQLRQKHRRDAIPQQPTSLTSPIRVETESDTLTYLTLDQLLVQLDQWAAGFHSPDATLKGLDDELTTGDLDVLYASFAVHVSGDWRIQDALTAIRALRLRPGPEEEDQLQVAKVKTEHTTTAGYPSSAIKISVGELEVRHMSEGRKLIVVRSPILRGEYWYELTLEQAQWLAEVLVQ